MSNIFLDPNKSANEWLADVVENFYRLIESGEDPSIEIELPLSVKIEVRLINLPGVFGRKTISLAKSDRKD